jgi:tagatose-6-phosphate ketose/aldose isomerase
MTLAQLLDAPADEQAQRGTQYTPREIAQQATTWLDTAARAVALGPQLQAALDPLSLGTAQAPHVLLLGAGTSDFVGRSVQNELRSRWGTVVEAVPTTDFATHEQSLLVAGARYVSISFSRSGKSPESVLAAQRLLDRKPSAPQLMVTCDAAGTMASQLSQHPSAVTLLLDDAVNDRSLAMTSSYSNMVLAGLAFAHYRELQRFERIVSALAGAWRSLLDAADELAERLAARRFSRVYYLGSGALNGVARESALKLLELTSGRVSSGSESFLGIRHGPLSALDGKALVVGLVSSDARVRRYELDLLREVQQKKLAEELVVIAQRPEAELRAVASVVLELDLIEEVSDDHLAPVMVLFGQLLGLYSSLAQGLKPDAPSPGGVINRVVAGVEMHT